RFHLQYRHPPGQQLPPGPDHVSAVEAQVRGRVDDRPDAALQRRLRRGGDAADPDLGRVPAASRAGGPGRLSPAATACCFRFSRYAMTDLPYLPDVRILRDVMIPMRD